jgi:hypothetical protein
MAIPPSGFFIGHDSSAPKAKEEHEEEQITSVTSSVPMNIPQSRRLTEDRYETTDKPAWTDSAKQIAVQDYIMANDEVSIRKSRAMSCLHNGLDVVKQSMLLKAAVEKQDKDMITALKRVGYNFNVPSLMNQNENPTFETALTYAIKQQKSEAIAGMVAVGVDVNQANIYTELPIHLAVSQAVQSGNTEPLKALLRGFPELRNFSDEQKRQLQELAKIDPAVKACLRELIEHKMQKSVETLQFGMES